MQFWLKCASVLVISGYLGGCASPEDREVNEDHQYVNAEERGELKLPEGHVRRSGDDSFHLPKNTPAGKVGETLDIRSPVQLLALASGSRLDEQNKVSKIWFDRTDVVEDLPKFTFDALKSYLKSEKVADASFDDSAKTADTGWIVETKEGGFWPWSEDDSSISHRFDTVQTQRAKGYITSVDVKLTGVRRNGETVAVSSLPQEYINRAETNFLNQYVYHFQLMQEVLMKKAQIARAEDFTLTLADSGQFHSAKAADTVWVEFRTLIENLGFTVDDVDRTSKILFVTYAEPDEGFWSSLWSDDDKPLSLSPAQYVIKVSARERQSSIVLMDKDQNPLPQSTMQEIASKMIKKARAMELEL